MSEIPFCEFQGFLKQLDLSGRSEVEQLLFAELFPHFFHQRVMDPAIRQKNEEMIRPFPYCELKEDLAQPRRFAGVSLSRGKYLGYARDTCNFSP